MAFKDNFRGDSAYTQIMTKIFNIFWLSILWLLCCIPVVTIVASTIALYYVMLKLVKDEETTVTREFFHSFKQNFLQSLPVTVIFLVAVAVLVADFHILGTSGGQSGASFMYGFCIVLGIVCAAVFSYVFPLLSKFDNTIKKTFENAARLAASHIGQTLVITVVNLLPVIWFLVFPQTFSTIFWIWVFVGGGIQAFVNSLFLRKIFDQLVEA